MSTKQSITPEIENQIEFNFQQVPSALALDIPPEATAAMLHIGVAEYIAYTEQVYEQCKVVARDLLRDPATEAAITTLKRPRAGAASSTVITVGDSITTYRYGYAEILRALLELAVPEQAVQFINYGRAGYTSTHGIEHTYTQYIGQKPDWVFLMYGVNDMKRFGNRLLVSGQEYEDNMAHIIDAFLGIGSRVIAMTPTTVDEDNVNNNPDFQAWSMIWHNADIMARGAALREIGKARNIPVIDLGAIFTAKPDPALILPDGLHPSRAGHRLMIEQVLKGLADL